MTDYYAPWEIRFTPLQVLWLIEHLDLLREGKYPSAHKDTGYTDAPLSSRSIRASATFERPCQLAAELDWRLERCDINGKLLVAEVRGGINSYFDLSYEARQALRYCSGWRRRTMDFKTWLKSRRYREKMYTKTSTSSSLPLTKH